MRATVTRITLIVVTVALQFGLAVLAWGGFAVFFSEPALVGLTVAVVGLTVASCFVGGNLSAGEREDRGNRWVLIAFTLIIVPIAFVPAYTDRHGIWCIDGDVARWVGVALFAGGGMLRLWPVYVLGNRFSGLVAIQPGHTLVTGGVYRLIRHPSYLGMLVSTLGWVLAFRSGVGVLLAALLIPPIVARIHAEENLLRSEFGDEYDAYCARTARLIPGVY